MKTRHWILVFATCVLFAGCGCDQVDRIDQAVNDVNSIAEGLSEFADSPAGAVVPPQVRMIMKLLGVGAVAAVGLWQKVRVELARTKKTGSAIVAAVEKLPQAERDKVKAAVKAEMVSREIYSKANAVVDKFKTG